MPKIAVKNELYWPYRHHYDLTKGIEKYAEEHDWELEILPHPESRIKRGIHFDGIVGRIDEECLKVTREKQIPVVNTWMSSPVAAESPGVFIDPEKGGYMAIEHLYSRGHRRFVCFGWRGRKAPQGFYHGAECAAKKLNCPIKKYLIKANFGANFEASSQAWEELIQIIEAAAADFQAPLGILATADSIARVLVSELQVMGWSVPEDIAIIGIGNEDLLCEAQPTLSSIDVDSVSIGYKAAELLDQLLQGEKLDLKPIHVPPKMLYPRQTTDVFLSKNERVSKAMRYIVDHAHELITVVDIANAAGITQQGLNVLFHRELGHSIQKELNRLRIEHFKRLLKEKGNRPISQLYKLTGFGSHSQLYRAFHSSTGMSPGEYQKQQSGMLK